MKKIFLIFTCLVALLNAEVVSKTYEKAATGEGYGVTYEQAVDNALAEAVLKLNGAYVKTHQNSQTSMIKQGNDTDLYKNFNQQISKATNGRFSAFDVIEKEQKEDGSFRVVVSVKKTTTVKSYKAPGRKDNRRRIIVVPALEPNVYSIMGRDSEQVLRDLRFKIESSIHKTRKFNLLDRQAGEAQAAEHELIKNDSLKDEALKIGRTLGTDYMLLYSINDTETNRGKVTKVTGQKGQSSLDVFVSYQVIIMATRETRFADSISLNYKIKDDNARSYHEILDNIADTITSNVQAAIYPPKVEKISNNQAIFTQQMRVGTKLECYKKGAKIIDSYTKEATGYEEIFTGNAEVVNTNAKMSYAKVTSGKINKGDLCKFVKIGTNATREQSQTIDGGKEIKDVGRGSNGGFVF